MLTKKNSLTLLSWRPRLPTALLPLSVVFLAAGCARDVDGRYVEDVDDQATALAQGAPPGAADIPQHEITIASLPDSICNLTEDETGSSMSVLADDEGLVHLWAARTVAPKAFTLDCDEPNGFAGNRRAKYRFSLADEQTFDRAMPRALSKRRRVIPALASPTAISQRELIAAGYPPRPPENSPRYELWLALVSAPFTSIDAPIIPTDLTLGPATSETSYNWGGVALEYPFRAGNGTRYTQATTLTIIPTFYQQGSSTSMAALWNGLGGVWEETLIQQGVLATSTGGVTTYQTAVEYLPESLFTSSFIQNPGNAVYWSAYECDANGNYGPSARGHGCFWFWNTTTNMTVSYRRPKPSGAIFLGFTCEVMVERLKGCGGFCQLSKWSGVAWSTLTCSDSGLSNVRNLSTDPYQLSTLASFAERTLATVSVSNPHSVGVDWLHSN